MKRFLAGVAAAIGIMWVVPELMKRHLAPPQRPQPHTPADLGLPEVPLVLQSVSGVDLHAWFIPADGPAPAVIVLHGWGANASLMLPFAPHIRRAGLHSLFLDARNHGRSDHDDFVSMPRFAEDLEIAIDWLHAHPDVTTVGVVGHSVGGGAALLAGARRSDIGAIVAVSTFAHPGETMESMTPLNRMPAPMRSGVLKTMERTIGAKFDDIAPRATISSVTSPLMLVHGEADTIVPIGDLEQLAELAPRARVLRVPGAGHSSLEPFEPHISGVVAFLADHLRT